MKNKQFPNGPSLEISFDVLDEKIVEIFLTPKRDGGLICSIQGKCSSALKKDIEAWLLAYTTKKQPSIRLPLDFRGLTPYTETVLSVLRHVPFQCHLTYQELAALTKKPKAARAVGGACGRNPFPLIIPCHRVLAHNSRIGGFSAGVRVKEILLDFEGISYKS